MRPLLFSFGFLLVTAPNVGAVEVSWSIHNNFYAINGGGSASAKKRGQAEFFRRLEETRICEQKYFKSNSYKAFACPGPLEHPLDLARIDSENYAYDRQAVFGIERYGKERGKKSTTPKRLIKFKAKFGSNIKEPKCRWTTDGYTENSADNAVDSKTASCDNYIVLELGKHSISLDVLAGKTVVEQTQLEINVRDVVIVVLGNSFASGEGNPHRRPLFDTDDVTITSATKIKRPPVWWEPRCHRSLFSSAHLGAALAAQADPHLSVTLLSFACSGASILEGITGPFVGVETQGDLRRLAQYGPPTLNNHYTQRLIKPQLDAAERSLCRDKTFPGKGKCVEQLKVDFVIGAIGMNDLEWVDLIGEAFTSGCKTMGSAECASLKKKVRAVRNDTPELYNSRSNQGLFVDFDSAVSKTLRPKQKILLGYPSPAFDENGKYCDDYKNPDQAFVGGDEPLIAVADFGLSAASNEILSTGVLDFVVGKMEKFAASTNWQIITPSDGKGHGYCASLPWYNSYELSLIRQGFKVTEKGKDLSTGALHPNLAGHYAGALLIKKEIESYVLNEP